MGIVFMFPGQTSVYAGMIQRAVAIWPEGTVLLEEASDVLGWDASRHFRPGNERIFCTNEYVQIGGFLTSHIHLSALLSAGIDADISAGLSLGEYNHLVHIGALGFADALRLVAARGRAYEAGPNGKMVAVFPMEPEHLEEIVADCAIHGMVEIAGYNSPLQHMVGGEHAAIDALIAAVEEETGLPPTVTEARLPIHTSCFAPVSATFAVALEAAPWQPPRRAYRPNVTGRCEIAADAARFVALLADHVRRPVLWRASIERIWAEDPDAVFVEVGPKSVLHNMLSRTWLPCERARTDDPEGFGALIDRLSRRS